MTDHAKVGRRSRQKGAQGERDVANELRVIYPDAARGGLLQTQYGRGSNACDVEHTPWWVEVKRGARPNIQGAFEQATSETDGRPPLVVSRKDRSVWLATMSLERFIHLVRIIQEYQKALDPEFQIVAAESGPRASDDSSTSSAPAEPDDEDR
jgi:hypothetical protein